MQESKLYFEDKDSEACYPLSTFIREAIKNKQSHVELYEAIEDDKWTGQHYCNYHGAVVDNSECRKNQCSQYYSRSGRGKCMYRGKFYFKSAEKVIIEVS